MKGRLDFDPALGDYGPGTVAVRQILSTWADLDWFEAPGNDGAAARATALFLEHQRLACAHAPDLFSEKLTAQMEVSDWEAFASLASRVREQSGWDWKYSALKQLSNRHSKGRSWSRDEAGRSCRAVEEGGPRPGDLFLRFGEVVVWRMTGPEVDFRAHLEPAPAELAGWYRSYAVMDLIDCIEWQLAERSDRLEGNPFWPLLLGYGTGFYPFCVDRSAVVLFAFGPRR